MNTPENRPIKPEISYEDYEKLDIRICRITSVEKVEKADKLYKMTINTGVDIRTVVSAIADKIEIDRLYGQEMPFILNLAPRKIRGIMSEAMIILAETKSNNLLRLQIAPYEDSYSTEALGSTII